MKQGTNTMMKKFYFSKRIYYDGHVTAQNEDDAFERVKSIDFEEISFNQLKELDVKISDNGDSDSVYIDEA